MSKIGTMYTTASLSAAAWVVTALPALAQEATPSTAATAAKSAFDQMKADMEGAIGPGMIGFALTAAVFVLAWGAIRRARSG